MSANKWFDRVVFWTRERPTSGDWNKAQTAQAESMRIMAKAVFGEPYASLPSVTPAFAVLGYAPEGFTSDAFFVEPDASSGAMAIRVRPGHGLHAAAPTAATDYSSASGLNVQALAPSPLVLSDYARFTVPASETAGNSRIDIIEVRADYTTTDSATVGIFNPITRIFDPTAKNKTFTWDLLTRTGSVVSPANSTAPISYKKGAAYAGGIAGATEPSTTPGYIKIARINLDGSVTTITSDLLADLRRPLLPNGNVTVSGNITFTNTGTFAGSTFNSANLPPGLTVAITDGGAGGSGTSRNVRILVLGGDIRPRSSETARPTLLVNPTTGGTFPLTAHVIDQGFGVTTAALSGAVGGGAGVPIGTRYAYADFQLADPAGGSLPAPLSANFLMTWSLG